MGRKQKQIKKMAISREIRDFTQDVYDYIWSKQSFFTTRVAQDCSDEFSSRYLSVGERKNTHFTENIGKAVRVSQFLLRDYFLNFFKFLTTEKSYFKKEVKLLWSHWIDNRNDIFIKVIETIAILAEAFLFCDCHMSFKLEFNETIEWFIELFEENLASEFFNCGGWEKLNPPSDGWYIGMFHFLEERAYMSYSSFHSDDVKTIYNCDVINIIRYCPVVKYPVPENVICDNCRHPDDATFFQSVVYVRLANEKPEIIPSTETDNSTITLPTKKSLSKVKNDSLPTGDKISSKYPFEDTLTVKQDYPLLKLEEQNFNVNNSKYISERCASLCSKLTSTNVDHTIQQDFKSSAEENFRKNLKEASIRLLATTDNSSIKENLPKNKNFVPELNVTHGQNEEISNEIVATPKENTLPDDIFSENRLKYPYERHAEEKQQCSFVNFESNIPSSANSEINYETEFPPDIIHITPHLKQSPKSELSLDASPNKWPSPESSIYLQKTLINNDRTPTKPDLKIVSPEQESSNTQDSSASLEVHFHKSDSLYNCLRKLHQAVLYKDCQTKELSSQNRFHLISEKFSNCLGLLFKDNLKNSAKDIPKSLKMSEVSEETRSVNKNPQKESRQSDLFSLKFESCTYSFYFIGEQELLQPAKQTVKKKKNKK